MKNDKHGLPAGQGFQLETKFFCSKAQQRCNPLTINPLLMTKKYFTVIENSPGNFFLLVKATSNYLLGNSV